MSQDRFFKAETIEVDDVVIGGKFTELHLPKPYYQDDAVTVYHGDCREILPLLPKVDLVLTDPPYNVGKGYGKWDDSLPEHEYESAMQEIVGHSLEKSDKQAWIAPRYKLPLWMKLLPGSHLVVIRRGAAGPFRAGWSDQFEIALAIGKPSTVCSDLWDDIRLKGEGYFFREETYEHPGYTPYPIMRRFCEIFNPETVLDPFMGSGTTLRAAKDLGRKAIGIEICEKYCEIAARRMEQEVLNFSTCENQGNRYTARDAGEGSRSPMLIEIPSIARPLVISPEDGETKESA